MRSSSLDRQTAKAGQPRKVRHRQQARERHLRSRYGLPDEIGVTLQDGAAISLGDLDERLVLHR